MEERFVLYLIVLFAVLVFVALIALSFGAYRSGNGLANSGFGSATSVITLSATGSASAKPTQAEVSISVNGTGLTTSSAVQNMSATLNRFNSTIYKFLNGNMSLMETTYYSVYKPYSYCPILPQRERLNVSPALYPVICAKNSTGYTAAEDISVTLPSIDNTSAFLGAIAAIPNVYVASVSPALSSSQAASLRSAALTDALSNATSQADALLGPNAVIYSRNISVNSYYSYPYGAYANSGSLSAGGGGNTTIGPQFYTGISQETESVSVVFHYGSR